MPKPPTRPAAARPETVTVDAGPFTLEAIGLIARSRAKVALSSEALESIQHAHDLLNTVLNDGQPHYGINTGFGSFSRQRISPGDLADLQRNLIRSHAAGVGPALPIEVVRAMMACLIGSLSRGHSGVRPIVVRTLIDMLNAGITPVVPETGSVGASGDLAPLAHVALALIGEGEVVVDDRQQHAASAMKAAKIKPVALAAKEGLALINGTHLMAAQASLFLLDFDRVFDAALVAAAMSIDACRGTDSFLDARVHEVRHQVGQAAVAHRLRDIIAGSKIIPSHRLNDPRVQDPYSLRCVPQVLGAVHDSVTYIRGIVEAELGAVTDNPLIFDSLEAPPSVKRPSRSQADVISAGNFHGMPLAIPLDLAAISCAHVAGIAERRVYHMLSAFDSETGLPPYLSPKPGLHSGLMIAQYTAAACCNEIITLCSPASVVNISTSAGMEDYNSFGPRAAAKARRALQLARSVVAIELLCAGEAIEHHRPLRSSPRVEAALRVIRAQVPKLTADRPPAPDIAAIEAIIASGAIAHAAK